MRQFLLADAAPGMTRDLTGADYHYLARVRRLTAGAQLTVMDRAGVRYAAQVTAVGGGRLRLLIGARAAVDAGTGLATAPADAPADAPRSAAAPAATETAPGSALDTAAAPGSAAPQAAAAPATAPADPPTPAARTPTLSLSLTLIQALPKGALMDRIVRQATELGVRAIVPVVAARSQGPSRSGEALARRWARWQRIARQAAQQSGAAPPAVEHPLPLAAYLEARAPADLELVFEPGTEPLHRLLARWAPAAAAAAGVPGAVEVRCAVGPEGAFSPAELDLFAAHGFHLVGLDAPVLRVDTAVTAALAATRQLLAGVADRWPHAQPTPAQPT